MQYPYKKLLNPLPFIIIIIICSIPLLVQAQIQNNTAVVLPDQNGRFTKVNEVNGKYQYLYFWTSWDTNSNVNVPRIIDLINKYGNANITNSDGFEACFISLDTNESMWRRAINLYQSNDYKHFWDSRGFNGATAQFYGINEVPSSLFIDPQGNLIGKNMSFTAIDAYLDQRKKAPTFYYQVLLGTFYMTKFHKFDRLTHLGQLDERLQNDNSKKIYLGRYFDKNEAQATLLRALSMGYSEAQIVPFKNNQPLSDYSEWEPIGISTTEVQYRTYIPTSDISTFSPHSSNTNPSTTGYNNYDTPNNNGGQVGRVNPSGGANPNPNPNPYSVPTVNTNQPVDTNIGPIRSRQQTSNEDLLDPFQDQGPASPISQTGKQLNQQDPVIIKRKTSPGDVDNPYEGAGDKYIYGGPTLSTTYNPPAPPQNTNINKSNKSPYPSPENKRNTYSRNEPGFVDAFPQKFENTGANVSINNSPNSNNYSKPNAYTEADIANGPLKAKIKYNRKKRIERRAKRKLEAFDKAQKKSSELHKDINLIFSYN